MAPLQSVALLFLKKKYAILGDDVVIADTQVAKSYEGLLGLLGVTICYQKSMISETGACEFAKRFRVKEGRVDLSPISGPPELTSPDVYSRQI